MPFSERRGQGRNEYLRTFTRDVPDEELVWHRDREDRIIRPTHQTDWMFQMDNQLPVLIDRELHVPAGEYHRIIRGTGDLTLSVTKLI